MRIAPTGALVPPFFDDYQPRLFTAADIAAMPTELPSGTFRYELHHGRLISLPLPTYTHAAAVSNVVAALVTQGEHRSLGTARCRVGIVLGHDPDHVLGPDAAFIANDRLPLSKTAEDYLLTRPNLVIEVRDRWDTLAALGRKAQDYLDAGVVVVWVVDPINRNVQEHRQGQPVVTIDAAGTLTVPDIIPGFALAVSAAL
jgi:Uma2 family endonuclease